MNGATLNELLERAWKALALAGELGRAFWDQGQHRAIFYDPSIWPRHATNFAAFCDALIQLQDLMTSPPEPLQPVAEQLLQAAKIAREISNVLSRDGGFTDYLDFAVELNTVSKSGWEAVEAVKKSKRLDDRFAFIDKVGEAVANVVVPEFTLLDRFPATQAGHIGFLELVKDEVRIAAEAKRLRSTFGYSNDTLDSMVRGISWSEARTRLALITMPTDVLQEMTQVLQRTLTVGTLEQIDGLLQPAVWRIREYLEQSRIDELTSKIAVIKTAGDLWKAYSEGKRPCFQASGVSLRPGANTPLITATDDVAEATRLALDRAEALVTAEGGEKAAAMEKLIARVQLGKSLDKRNVINMPLAEFVAAATEKTAAVESPATPARRKLKRSTERGEGIIKCIAALTKHHQYATGGCLSLEPIGNNDLARMANVDKSTASAFFKQQFGGHRKYVVACADATTLVASLRLLNGEVSPHHLFGSKPPNEARPDDD